MSENSRRNEVVQGTLDMLILKTLDGGRMHGYAIARRIEQASREALRVEEGSLYPALHRMERRAWVVAEWGLSEAHRRAKYYSLTETGRAQLQAELDTWNRFVEAVARVLGPRPAEA